jgi:hypothetical protein
MNKPSFKLPRSYSFNWVTKGGGITKDSSGIVEDSGKSQEVQANFGGGSGDAKTTATLDTKKIGDKFYVNIEPLIEGDQQQDWVLLEPEPGSGIDPQQLEEAKKVLSSETPEDVVPALKKARKWEIEKETSAGDVYSALVSRRTLSKILTSGGIENQPLSTRGKK